MGQRNGGMYQRGKRDGRDGMGRMHFDIIPFALTPAPRKVPPPRKVPSPRKLFSNCFVPCGPDPPNPPYRTVLPLRMVRPGCPGAHLVLYTAEGELLHQNLNTFEYMPGQTGRAAGRPPGRPAIRLRGPGSPSAGPIGQAQTPENRLEMCFAASIPNLSGGAGGAKFSPRHVRDQCQREGLIYICKFPSIVFFVSDIRQLSV